MMAQPFIALWDIIPLLSQYPQIQEKFRESFPKLAECNTLCSLNVEKTLFAQCINAKWSSIDPAFWGIFAPT